MNNSVDDAIIAALEAKNEQLRTAIEMFVVWMESVPTDDQLDATVVALGGATGRALVSNVKKWVLPTGKEGTE